MAKKPMSRSQRRKRAMAPVVGDKFVREENELTLNVVTETAITYTHVNRIEQETNTHTVARVDYLSMIKGALKNGCTFTPA